MEQGWAARLRNCCSLGIASAKAQRIFERFVTKRPRSRLTIRQRTSGVAGVASDHCLPVECAVIDGEATPFGRDQHLCQLASVLAHLPHRCEHVFQVGRFITLGDLLAAFHSFLSSFLTVRTIEIVRRFFFMTLLPRKGLLAIAVVVDLALQTEGQLISAKTLAIDRGLPPRHLESLFSRWCTTASSKASADRTEATSLCAIRRA